MLADTVFAQPGQRYGGGAHQPAAAVAAVDHGAGVVELGPRPQHVGEAEPVTGPEVLDVVELVGGWVVVVGESGIEGHPGAAPNRLRGYP